MYCTIESFLFDWEKESESTHKVLSALSDESLNQKVYPQGRTLGKIAWHIVQTLGEMMNKTGLSVEAPDESAPVPSRAEEIASAYIQAADSLADELKLKWTNDILDDEIELYDMKWTRKLVLSGLIKHEIHHRAQITVLMRQAGLAVPGVYGPAKEEWSQYGMPQQD